MIGRTISGVYRVLELVGGGGFADVYLARDVRSNTVVGLKVMHAHIARDPDLTRLLDRMDRNGWVERSRGQADRRVVLAGITAEGLSLLKSLDSAILVLHRHQFAELGDKKTAALVRLLEALCEPRQRA